MKRALLWSIILCFLVALIMATPAFAVVKSNSDAVEQITINTVTDAEEFIQKYFQKRHMKIEIGTSKYIDYLMGVLTYEDDQVLAKYGQYENFKIYASEYLSQIDNPSAIVNKDKKVLLNKSEHAKTIAKIKQEARIEESSIVALSTNDISTRASKGGYYNKTRAIAYARKWAMKRNPAYGYEWRDCTNYVSQCLVAGGKSMKKSTPLPMGTKYSVSHWYSVRFQDWHGNKPAYVWKQSTSFVRVTDFYTYWKKQGATVIVCANKSRLQKTAKPGDIIQLKDGSGKWYHSIIITGGKQGSLTYCSHTLFRKDRAVSEIQGAVSYRILRL